MHIPFGIFFCNFQFSLISNKNKMDQPFTPAGFKNSKIEAQTLQYLEGCLDMQFKENF